MLLTMSVVKFQSLCFCVLVLSRVSLSADQIQMQNGDRYIGRLVTFTNDTLVVQSAVLGTIHLPRSKVALISFEPFVSTNAVRATSQLNQQLPPVKALATRTDSDFSASLRQLQGDTNSIQKIQQQFLRDAGPEANKKFTEMAEGLMGGQINLSDLRAQAASAAQQLRALKREGGQEAGSSLDGYLAILESFLNEAEKTPTSTTNRPAPPGRKVLNPLSDDE